MAFRAYFLGTALVASLAIVPAAHADHWRGGWGYDYGRYHNHHRHNNPAAAAIIGGLVGLGVGAAIASGGGYYAPPGYYYDAPPPTYYAPPPAYYEPPPGAYYGY